jgi:FkbM family methyltransferase
MTFISYAQNLEDVMLWRALKNVRSGFYIDVGACDPHADSVTKAFYEMGWRGINVEPMPAAFEKLSTARPRDINLKMALGAANGTRKFYSIDGGNGLSTSVAEYAETYRANDQSVEELEVETTTLAQICSAFVNQDVSFLKIDVEGGEKAVLEGADFEAFRPWIVVVESTEPNTTKPSHGEWEPILLRARYAFVFFDGLNRYYVANEKMEMLGGAFTAPPNWFDHYETSTMASLRAEREQIKQQLASIEAITFPSFIAEEDSLAEKVVKLIDNHLFLSEKASAAAAAPAQIAQLDSRANHELAELQSKADGLVQQVKELNETLKTVRLENVSADGQTNQLREEVACLVEDNARLVAKNGKLNMEADACYQELYESSRHIGVMSRERGNLNARIASLEHEVRHYMALSQNAHAPQLHADIASLHGHIAMLDGRISTLNAHISTLDAQISTRDAHISTLNAQIDGLRGSRSWRLTAPLRGLPILSKNSGKSHG